MLKYLSKEETLHFLEMSHEKYEWDVASRMADAREDGFVEGEARGDYEGTLRVARAALSEGAPIDFIKRITGLDAEAIKHLQEN
jgi:3-oxoacyl-(acyl-carrier-protein) synthase